MRRLISTLLTATFTVALLTLAAQPAAADGFDAYVDAMTDFEPTISEWVAEYDRVAQVASVKPTHACSDEVARVARLGRSIEADMAGTREIAPRLLDDTHGRLQGAIGWMSRVAETTCGGEMDMLADTEPEREGADVALTHLRTWLANNQRVIRELPIPSPGNH